MSDVYRNGKVHVCAERCATCVFRPGNLMHLERGRLADMVASARSYDQGGHIICHDTLDAANAVCRGWFDRYAAADPVFRLAQAFDVVAEV
jgi:hypothetical protein